MKKKFNVDMIWSWSRYKTYKTSPYEYYLKYVARVPEDKENIYLSLGSNAHEVIERFYLGEISYNEMIDLYITKKDEVEFLGKKFIDDPEKNKSMGEKYHSCCEHFYKTHNILDGEILIEQFINVMVGDNLFTGYIDAINKVDDIYYITDWKTSTAYTGKKILEEQGQLLLYSYALHKKGVPLDKIKARWNFLKYVNVSYMQKNGKIKTTKVERNMIVKKLEKRILSFAKDLGYDENELTMYIEMNDFNLLPDDIKEIFTFNDCYVEVEVSEESINNLVDEIINTIDEINDKTKKYNKTKDDLVFDEEINSGNYFYFANLCSYGIEKHKPFRRYIDKKNEDTFLTDELIDLGL